VFVSVVCVHAFVSTLFGYTSMTNTSTQVFFKVAPGCLAGDLADKSLSNQAAWFATR